MLVLVVYDIPDDRRRAKIATFLEGYGRRVQYSVFECFISLDEMQRMHSKLLKRVKPEDNIRLYWITPDALERTLTIGSPSPEPPPGFYII
jgi:CRISPR-associated protein Cas2